MIWESHPHRERDPCYCFQTGRLIEEGSHRRQYILVPRSLDYESWRLYDLLLSVGRQKVAEYPPELSEADAKRRAEETIQKGL